MDCKKDSMMGTDLRSIMCFFPQDKVETEKVETPSYYQELFYHLDDDDGNEIVNITANESGSSTRVEIYNSDTKGNSKSDDNINIIVSDNDKDNDNENGEAKYEYDENGGYIKLLDDHHQQDDRKTNAADTGIAKKVTPEKNNVENRPLLQKNSPGNRHFPPLLSSNNLWGKLEGAEASGGADTTVATTASARPTTNIAKGGGEESNNSDFHSKASMEKEKNAAGDSFLLRFLPTFNTDQLGFPINRDGFFGCGASGDDTLKENTLKFDVEKKVKIEHEIEFIPFQQDTNSDCDGYHDVRQIKYNNSQVQDDREETDESDEIVVGDIILPGRSCHIFENFNNYQSKTTTYPPANGGCTFNAFFKDEKVNYLSNAKNSEFCYNIPLDDDLRQYESSPSKALRKISITNTGGQKDYADSCCYRADSRSTTTSSVKTSDYTLPLANGMMACKDRKLKKQHYDYRQRDRCKNSSWVVPSSPSLHPTMQDYGLPSQRLPEQKSSTLTSSSTNAADHRLTINTGNNKTELSLKGQASTARKRPSSSRYKKLNDNVIDQVPTDYIKSLPLDKKDFANNADTDICGSNSCLFKCFAGNSTNKQHEDSCFHNNQVDALGSSKTVVISPYGSIDDDFQVDDSDDTSVKKNLFVGQKSTDNDEDIDMRVINKKTKYRFPGVLRQLYRKLNVRKFLKKPDNREHAHNLSKNAYGNSNKSNKYSPAGSNITQQTTRFISASEGSATVSPRSYNVDSPHILDKSNIIDTSPMLISYNTVTRRQANSVSSPQANAKAESSYPIGTVETNKFSNSEYTYSKQQQDSPNLIIDNEKKHRFFEI